MKIFSTININKSLLHLLPQSYHHHCQIHIECASTCTHFIFMSLLFAFEWKTLWNNNKWWLFICAALREWKLLLNLNFFSSLNKREIKTWKLISERKWKARRSLFVLFMFMWINKKERIQKSVNWDDERWKSKSGVRSKKI